MLRFLRLFAIHFLVYLPLVLVLQYATGIYRSELSHDPDESAHVITSLMIHDYAQSGLGSSPLRFAENYYVHYPKVAIGIWPPVFHATAALGVKPLFKKPANERMSLSYPSVTNNLSG